MRVLIFAAVASVAKMRYNFLESFSCTSSQTCVVIRKKREIVASRDILEPLGDLHAQIAAQIYRSRTDTKSREAEEAEAKRRLKAKTPPSSELLKLVARAEVPPKIEDLQEERPW